MVLGCLKLVSTKYGRGARLEALKAHGPHGLLDQSGSGCTVRLGGSGEPPCKAHWTFGDAAPSDQGPKEEDSGDSCLMPPAGLHVIN